LDVAASAAAVRSEAEDERRSREQSVRAHFRIKYLHRYESRPFWRCYQSATTGVEHHRCYLLAGFLELLRHRVGILIAGERGAVLE
jgi:hypothetical protein